MKAAIYNPYLDTLGGGERYTLSFAKILAEKEYRVDVQWSKRDILNKLEKRFGMDLKDIGIVSDIKRGDGYDVCFWVSDGSIPLLRARRNFLHFQVPFRNVNGRSLMNKMKLFRINKVIVNSNFTKKYIDKEYGVDSLVIYPPVDTERFKSGKKENVILNVGRFSHLLQSKNQHILVNTFIKFYNSGYKNWRLILAGGIEVGTGDYIDKLKKIAKDYPIEIILSPDFNQLNKLYNKSKIFWSAVGYGFDDYKNPTKVEHFGISVVEAMASGAVPFAFKAGGYKEIIKEGFSGFLWRKQSELLKKTRGLIEDKGLYNTLSRNVQEESKKFNLDTFRKNVLTTLK